MILNQVTGNDNCKRVDVVFDVYLHTSIKNVERSKRSSQAEGIKYKNILPGYQVKSWSKFLALPSNKTEVVKFLVAEWKKTEMRDKLSGKTLYVTCQSECWKLDPTSVELVTELQSNQEEADTRMLLHTQHAINEGPVVIHADDTDVLVLLLGHNTGLRNCYLKKGKGSKTRLLNLEHISNGLLKNISPGIEETTFFIINH